jgi:hypothetical protein
MSFAGKLRHLGTVVSDVRWLPFYLQRRVMSSASRKALTRLAVRLRPRVPATQPSSDSVLQRVADLRHAGISHLGNLLSAAQTQELRDYFSSKLVSDPYRPRHGTFLPHSNDRHPESHIAHHDEREIVRAPYLFALANHPVVLEVVARHLGCRPTLGYLAAWWSYHTAVGAQQAEHFHRDVDDWKFVKLFVYLSDVNVNNGPHVYVTHSAASPQLRQIRRFPDSEVIEAFGQEKVLKLTGRAGEGFLEDTFGIHKGQPVLQGRRLIFQAVYSMFALPYGPKQPVTTCAEMASLHSIQIDPWINRLYVQI